MVDLRGLESQLEFLLCLRRAHCWCVSHSLDARGSLVLIEDCGGLFVLGRRMMEFAEKKKRI